MSLWICGGGIKPGSPCQCLCWAQGPIQGRPTPRPWERPSSAINVAEGKGSNSVLVMTFWVISPNRKSTKTTKNKGKADITAIKYSTPDRAILFNFYNHPQPLWVWADGTSISPGTLNLHVDVGGRVNASIKRKEKQYRKGGTTRFPNHGVLEKGGW